MHLIFTAAFIVAHLALESGDVWSDHQDAIDRRGAIAVVHALTVGLLGAAPYWPGRRSAPRWIAMPGT